MQEEHGGGHEVYMPEPLAGLSGHGYRVRISQVDGGPNAFAFSDNFYLSSLTDAILIESFYLGTPSIAVVSPMKDSVAIAGKELTVEVGICFYPACASVFYRVKQPLRQHTRKSQPGKYIYLRYNCVLHDVENSA